MTIERSGTDDAEGADLHRTLATKRMGAGAVIRDADGNVLIVKPTYKLGWELPGGAVERDESPAHACARELQEELVLSVTVGSLLCVDYNSSSHNYVESLMFLFDTEPMDAATIATIELPAAELSECRFASVSDATQLLDPRVARRLTAVLNHRPQASVYLEDQHTRD